MALVLIKSGEYAFEEKRSKFIGYCTPVSSEMDAKQFVDSIRQRHSDATHNCFAYGIDGTAGNITRFGDDGEPQGTAGIPILNVFLKGGVVDFACVVTRYYGGVMLGAGGLVRAYSKAAKGALEASGVMQRFFYSEYKVICDYSQVDKVKYFFDKWGIEIVNSAFSDRCEMDVRVRDDLSDSFLKGDFYAYEKR